MPDEQVPSAGGNVAELKETIQDAHKELSELEDQREAINADVNAIRKKVKAAGVPLAVLDHARRIADMEADDRSEYDTLLDIVREALGVEHQHEMEI